MQNRAVYIIAEAGVNHNGSLELAKQLIDAAVSACADAVKFQTFKAGALVSRYAPKADYQKLTTPAGESQFVMLEKLELNLDQHRVLADYAGQKGIEFLSTPFDIDSVDLLVQELKVQRIKISSGDITNAPLLLTAARSGKPVILSTGMSTLGEIETALGVLAFGYIENDAVPSIRSFKKAYIREDGQAAIRDKVILLHCTTEYPAPLDEVNLRAINSLKAAFGLTVGYSDHTEGLTVPIAAVAMGAMVIEKHFTVDRNLPGPDHKASLEPGELKAMVCSIREVEHARGNGLKVPTASEISNIATARKSLVAACEIRKGSRYSEENLAVKRPGNGISPEYYWDLLGKKARRNYTADEMVEL